MSGAQQQHAPPDGYFLGVVERSPNGNSDSFSIPAKLDELPVEITREQIERGTVYYQPNGPNGKRLVIDLEVSE